MQTEKADVFSSEKAERHIRKEPAQLEENIKMKESSAANDLIALQHRKLFRAKRSSALACSSTSACSSAERPTFLLFQKSQEVDEHAPKTKKLSTGRDRGSELCFPLSQCSSSCATRNHADCSRLTGDGAKEDVFGAYRQLVLSPLPQRERLRVCASTGVEFREGQGVSQYQVEALAWMHRRKNGIMCAEMGLGKTRISLVFCLQCQRERPEPALLVVPGPIISEWEHEARLCFGNTVRIALYSKQSREELRALTFCLVTYDALLTAPPALFDIKWTVVIADESHKLSNGTTHWYKAALRLQGTRKFGLSGTPLTNKSRDIRSQLNWAVGADVVDMLNETELCSYLYSIDYERAHVDLPSKEQRVVEVEMDEMTRLLYDTVKNSAVLEIVKGGLLRQITVAPYLAGETLSRHGFDAPWVKLVDGPGGLGSPKFIALKALLQAALAQGKQVLVFSAFAQALYLAQRGTPCAGVISCETTDRMRADLVAKFKAGKLRVLMLTYQLGSLGHNFQNCQDGILLDLWWTKVAQQQAEARAFRRGQLRDVVFTRLFMKDSIDEHVYNTVQAKAVQLSQVLSLAAESREL